MRFFCWLGLHKWAWNMVANAIVGDRFCTRKGCLASKSVLSGKAYKRSPLFAPKSR